MSKKHIRQDSKIKMSLRLTMGVAMVAVGAFMFLLILVFNIMKDEISHAQTAMIFKTADSKYAKMEILSYYQDAPVTPTSTTKDRYYTFRYIYQADGSKKLK